MNLRFTGRGLTLATLALLSLWLVIWLSGLMTASPMEHVLWLMLALLPIAVIGCFALRGLKGGYVWCGFASLGYLAQGITVVMTNRGNTWAGAVEIFLSLLLFCSAITALRAWRRPG